MKRNKKVCAAHFLNLCSTQAAYAAKQYIILLFLQYNSSIIAALWQHILPCQYMLQFRKGPINEIEWKILVTPLVRIMVSIFHLILFIILELTPDFDIGYELIYKGVKHFLFTFKLLPSMCDFFLNCTIKVFL